MAPPRTPLTRGALATLLVGAGLVTLIALPPFVAAGPRELLMGAFSAVCHQLPARSPHLDGVQLAVCHRCLGIYLGLPLAALIYLAFRQAPAFEERRPLLLGLSAMPMVLDWGGEVLGLFRNTPGSRLATGLVFGLVAGAFLVFAFGQAGSSGSGGHDRPTDLS